MKGIDFKWDKSFYGFSSSKLNFWRIWLRKILRVRIELKKDLKMNFCCRIMKTPLREISQSYLCKIWFFFSSEFLCSNGTSSKLMNATFSEILCKKMDCFDSAQSLSHSHTPSLSLLLHTLKSCPAIFVLLWKWQNKTWIF